MLNYGDRSRASDATNPIADTRAGAKVMYRSFTIKNFRCFDELTVEGMGRINLIAGKNNVGKTALLEALWVHSGGPARPDKSLRLDRLRGLDSIEPKSNISHLFYSFDESVEIKLSAHGDWDAATRELSIFAEELDSVQAPLDMLDDEIADPNRPVPQKQLIVNYLDDSDLKSSSRAWLAESRNNPGRWNIAAKGDMPAWFLSLSCIYLLSRGWMGRAVDSRRYSQLEVAGGQEGVLRILREIEPSLQRIAVVATGSEPQIYVDLGLRQLIPIQLAGEGMSRLLSLALAIATASGGIVLVDEIENGIHHSVMEKVWKAIGAFARSYDVQLFATTHSYECIGAAYRAFEADEEDELRLFRIQRNSDGGFKAVKYDRERLGGVLELRMEFI